MVRLKKKENEKGMVVEDGYHLNLTLYGGEGDLFKFDNGGTFVPEPMTLSVLLFGSWMLVVRHPRRFSRIKPS